MTAAKFALYVTCLLMGRMADAITQESSSSSRFLSVSVGEDLTLECFHEDSLALMFFWYKQSLGQEPELVSKFYKHDKSGSLIGEFKNDRRIELETSPGKYNVRITDVQISDSATYHCMSGYSYVYEFMEGIIVHVKTSDLNVPLFIHQSASETIQPGDSLTLTCTVHTGTCDGEHNVYWFKNSEKTNPGLIFTRGGGNDQCEMNPNTDTTTCVYNLPMKNLTRSLAGTYYCAVALCGRIRFGNGTTVDIEDGVDSLVLVYILSAALALTTILAVLLAYKAFTTYKATSHKCTGPEARTSAALEPNAEGDQDSENLHYAALRRNKANRSTRQRDDSSSECVYSGVRQ
ncbi:uncharacterized protein LOC132958580 isoform X1 [Labrus mixtus]|uniref:uncharacterized protein LOC132958580 isoform X1 n=1 Tax=Labrus mixtus TaxID=508554 RepID=UPI0029C09759|nr:uncharacterized protein LOC132958580 isoform X1 [Labrus mixtus]